LHSILYLACEDLVPRLFADMKPMQQKDFTGPGPVKYFLKIFKIVLD